MKYPVRINLINNGLWDELATYYTTWGAWFYYLSFNISPLALTIFQCLVKEPSTKLAYSDNFLSVVQLVQCLVFLSDMVNKNFGQSWLWTVKTWLCTKDGKEEKLLWNPPHLNGNISHFSTENDFLSMLFAILSTWKGRRSQMGRRPIWLPSNIILADCIATKVKSHRSLGFLRCSFLFNFFFSWPFFTFLFSFVFADCFSLLILLYIFKTHFLLHFLLSFSFLTIYS